MVKGLVGFLVALGVQSAPIIQPQSENINIASENVIYHDEDFEIIFNEEETLYKYNNLINLFLEEINEFDFSNSYVEYNNIEYNYDSTDAEGLYYINGSTYIEFLYKDNDELNGYWCIDNGETPTKLSNGLTWSDIDENPTRYNKIKQAIELDIQANSIDESAMPSVSDLFGYITQGVTNFVQSLGQAFSSVTALFWDSTASTPGPTFVGLLMLVAIGAGLIYLAFNLVRGLIRRLRG